MSIEEYVELTNLVRWIFLLLGIILGICITRVYQILRKRHIPDSMPSTEGERGQARAESEGGESTEL